MVMFLTLNRSITTRRGRILTLFGTIAMHLMQIMVGVAQILLYVSQNVPKWFIIGGSRPFIAGSLVGPGGSLVGPGGSLMGPGGSWWVLVGPWWVTV